MTDFVIVSAATPDYARQIATFTPSWIRNSGAKEIHISSLPDPNDVGRKRCQGARNEAIWELTRMAQSRGLRVAMLDIDCWVLGSLHQAFDGYHPLAVARWPKINCGVQFYDTLLPFNFDRFLGDVVHRVNTSLGAMKPTEQVGLVEQKAWERQFLDVEAHVNKLDESVWNLCVDDQHWDQALRDAKDSVKIVHVKGRGQRKRQDWRIQAAYKVFGKRIHPDA